METSNMKNMIILRNPPSNLVEEAIIILKSNKRIQKLEYIENKKGLNKEISRERDYIIKEAESVISNYISKIEEKNKKKINLENKYNKLKRYSIIATAMLIIAIIKILI